MPINTSIKCWQSSWNSYTWALLITADGLVSLLLHLFSSTLGVILLPGNKEEFCSISKRLWDGISAPLCAKGEKNKVRASETV